MLKFKRTRTRSSCLLMSFQTFFYGSISPQSLAICNCTLFNLVHVGFVCTCCDESVCFTASVGNFLSALPCSPPPPPAWGFMLYLPHLHQCAFSTLFSRKTSVVLLGCSVNPDYPAWLNAIAGFDADSVVLALAKGDKLFSHFTSLCPWSHEGCHGQMEGKQGFVYVRSSEGLMMNDPGFAVIENTSASSWRGHIICDSLCILKGIVHLKLKLYH